MGDTVTITFAQVNIQPVILTDVKSIDIKKDVVLITGRGYRKVYFKESIHSINADYNIGIFVK